MDSLVTTPTPAALPPSEMRLQSFRPVCTLQLPSEFHRIRFLKDSFTQPASLTTSVPHGVLGLLNNSQHVCANLYLCWRHWCLCHLPKIQELELHAQSHVAFTDCYCTVWSYLSSTRLILHVVSRSNLGADILKVRSWCIDGSGISRCTGHWWLLLHWGLFGHRRFGDDSTAVRIFTISGGNRGSRCGRRSWATSCWEGRIIYS